MKNVYIWSFIDILSILLALLLQKTTTSGVTSPWIVMSSRLSVSQEVRYVSAHRDTASSPLQTHVSQVSFITTYSKSCNQYDLWYTCYDILLFFVCLI